ncbi:MAG: GHKL domain-containing protein, partial [Lachnospiraceae bacterium]|nr:GHKL domain-containing protein [Lachnospiraceae bacterium]
MAVITIIGEESINMLYRMLVTFQDALIGHIILVIYLFAIMNEKNRKERLRKLPPLILSPVIGIALIFGLDVVIPDHILLRYIIYSAAILCMCTLWVMWVWGTEVWPAFSATCMAGTFQVATTALLQVIYPLIPQDENHQDLSLLIFSFLMVLSAIIVSGLLAGKVRFGVWFRLLMEDESNQRRWAMLCLALEVAMDAFMVMETGVMEEFLAAYYLLAMVLVTLMTGLVVHLARRFDDGRRIQAQQDIIAQQQLYEQNLEEIRQEVRSFRHD